MRVPVVSQDGKPLMPTKPAKCRKMIESGVAKKCWSKEGVFYAQMLIPVSEETQEMALAIDPGSKYDGYAVSGTREVILQGMAVLPRNVRKRMETRRMLRHNRRYRKCRRREARFNNRKKKDGWIAPSQLAKVQLRIRIMQRLCQLLPITDILIEDVCFNHYEKCWGKYFSTVEIGKTEVYGAARELATLWLPQGWETAQARQDYGIEKTSKKSALTPASHANDAWAMICWLFGEKPKNTTTGFYVWRRQECSKRQLHLLQPTKGGGRKRHGGTTHPNSDLRKGDIIRYAGKVVGYVGGWRRGGKAVSLVGPDGKRIRQAGVGTIKLLARAPHILTKRKEVLFSLLDREPPALNSAGQI